MQAQTAGYKAKAFEARNLIFYFLIALGLPWISGGLIVLDILRLPPRGEPLVVDIGTVVIITLYVLANLSPTIAAFVVTGITEGKPGVKALWKRFWNRSLRIKWLLAAILFVPVMRLVANLIIRTLDSQAYPFLAYPNLGMAVSPFISAFIVNGMAEEFGWRGYVLPRFQARWSALTASIVLGVLWAAWHFPGLFIPQAYIYQRNVLEFTLWIILCSVIYTWIFNNTNGSVLAVVLFHAAVNTAFVWCCSYADVADPRDLILYGTYLLAVILIVIIFGPKNLVRLKPEPTKILAEGTFARGEKQAP